MEFFIEAFNIKRVKTQFNRLGAASLDATPAFEAARAVIYRIEGALFDSQGRRGGGSWRRDSQDWLLRKQREGLDPRINHATLALRNSLTMPDDPNQVMEITPFSMKFGSTLPYAATTQSNRPVIKFTPYDRAALRGVIRTHLMAAWRAP